MSDLDASSGRNTCIRTPISLVSRSVARKHKRTLRDHFQNRQLRQADLGVRCFDYAPQGLQEEETCLGNSFVATKQFIQMSCYLLLTPPLGCFSAHSVNRFLFSVEIVAILCNHISRLQPSQSEKSEHFWQLLKQVGKPCMRAVFSLCSGESYFDWFFDSNIYSEADIFFSNCSEPVLVISGPTTWHHEQDFSSEKRGNWRSFDSDLVKRIEAQPPVAQKKFSQQVGTQPHSTDTSPSVPGVEWVLLKVTKRKWTEPRWTGPYKVIERTSHAVRLEGKGDAWYHWTQCAATDEPGRTMSEIQEDLRAQEEK
ncbi:uncharacterized protein [Nothobranchius furzeri]|uniref:uncharacterized protein n=1 Tax=Nothobranchius furzeri TaxID=105023 RepID=UPI0039046914